jgi:hypothetical protein
MSIKEKLETPFKKKYEEFQTEQTHKRFVSNIRDYEAKENEQQEREQRTMEEVRNPKPSLFKSLGSKAGSYVKQELAQSRQTQPQRQTGSGRLSQQRIFAPITQMPKQRGFVGVGDQSIARQGSLSPMLEGAFFGGNGKGGSAIDRAFSSGSTASRQPRRPKKKKKVLLGRKPKYLEAFM